MLVAAGIRSTDLIGIRGLIKYIMCLSDAIIITLSTWSEIVLGWVASNVEFMASGVIIW